MFKRFRLKYEVTYMSQNKTIGCPSCGSTKGYKSSQWLTQYYDVNGEPDGYDFDDSPALTVICRNCGKRIKLKDIKIQTQN